MNYEWAGPSHSHFAWCRRCFVHGELGDEGLLPLRQLRWLGGGGGGQLVALNKEGVDGASEVACDEEFELGVGEEAVLRARVLEAVDGLPGLRDGIVLPGAICGANEADDGIALLQVLGQHALHIMRGRVPVWMIGSMPRWRRTSATCSARAASPAVVREMRTRGWRDILKVYG